MYNLTMRHSPPLGRFVLLGTLAASTGGCSSLLGSFMAKSPYVQGTWTGRLRSVTVQDYKGDRYTAAALEIESGPRTLRPRNTTGGEYTLAAGEAPHLTRNLDALDPNSLGIPLGARLRVSGKMSGGPPMVYAYDPLYGRVRRDAYRIPGDLPGGGIVLDMWEDPKLLTK